LAYTAEIEKLAATKTGVVLNILSNLRLRSGIAPISAYRRLGVPLALGCDNCSCSDVQSMFQVMKFFCLLGGISDPLVAAPLAAEALNLGTVGGARSAGRADQIGAIVAGMKADLVALDLSDPAYRPLNSIARQIVYADSGRSLRHVWVNGRHVIQAGNPVSIDEDRLDATLARLMPEVRRQLESMLTKTASVGPAFDEIHRRAWSIDIGYDRYLQRN